MGKLFADRVAWITGGGSGIGRACAVELARQGASVAVSGRRVDKLGDVVRDVEAAGGAALAVACDVRDEGSVQSAVRGVLDRFGRLDVALANAGFSVSGTVEELDVATWRGQLETNVIGAALTARHCLAPLRETSGRLALVGSVAAFIYAPGYAAYSASKAAVHALGQTLSAELRGSGVSCTTVHPGYVESEIAQVDNQGRFDAARADRRPQNLMWPADRAARVIVRAIHRRKRELVFTGHGKFAAFLGRHMPGVAYAFISRGGKRVRPPKNQ
jgi:NAD(P)-dependent dehydrogenase (short-subunit alcohol dehydrogenase family)